MTEFDPTGYRGMFPKTTSIFGFPMADITRTRYISYEEGQYDIQIVIGDLCLVSVKTDNLEIYDRHGIFLVEYSVDGVDIVDNCIALYMTEDAREHCKIRFEEHDWDVNNRVDLWVYRAVLAGKVKLEHCSACGRVIPIDSSVPAEEDPFYKNGCLCRFCWEDKMEEEVKE